MFNTKPPLRLAITQCLLDDTPKTLEQIMLALEPEYNGMKIFKSKTIDAHLQALKAVGIIKIIENDSKSDSVQENDNPVYTLTKYGKEKTLKNL